MNAPASTILRRVRLRKARTGSRRWRAGLLCVAACVTLVATAPARGAEAEEEKTFDEKIIDSILKGAGLRDDRAAIEYRERSPLVIPPGNALPAPGESAAKNNPNWPVDPEIKRARAAAKSVTNINSYGDPFIDESRPLRPGEMVRGRRAESGTPTFSDRDPSDPMRPSELGAKRGLFGALFSSDEEAAPFTGEPPRTSLVEPPRGYQTPSPAQPYGVGKSRAESNYDRRDNYTTRVETRE